MRFFPLTPILACFIIIVSGPACNKKTAPKTFEIEKGLELRLVASEPLIIDPVDMEFDTRGNLWVLEMPGYPFEDSASRLKILNDTNADGVMDRATTFAQGLNMATSFLHYKEGVLLGAPPYLLYMRDQNKDGRADNVDTLMGGFSTGNLQHNFNGMMYGLDQWIYIANGGNEGSPYWWGNENSKVELKGDDLRINIVERKMERTGRSSGGYGIAMDEYGHYLGTHNTQHISQLVFPGRYMTNNKLLFNHTLSNISDHEENGLARIYPVGEQESRVNHPEQSGYFSGACGISYYGDDELGENYKGTVWVADVVLNLVHVDRFLPNESSVFKASRLTEKREVLASTDRSFRPVNTVLAPDGSVYIIDMYRKVIEHPEWIPDEIEQKLDLNAGKDKGRIYQLRKDGSRTTFDFRQFENMSSLVGLIQHKNQWVRGVAHRLLAEREWDAEATKKIHSNLKNGSAYARLHSAWLLHYKHLLTNDEMVDLLRDEDSGIRENALIMAEGRANNDPVILEIVKCLTDKNQRVRMQAGLTVSVFPDDIYSKYQKEILAALFASGKLLNDQWNIAAITLGAKNSDTTLFAKLVTEQDSTGDLLRSLSLSSAKSEAHLKAILRAAASINNGDVKQNVVKQIAGLDFIDFNVSDLLAPIIKLETTNDINLISSLAKIRNSLDLPPSAQYLEISKSSLKRLETNTESERDRLADLAAIEMVPYNLKASALFKCLDNREPLKVQEEAMRQLSWYNEKQIGEKIISMWSSLGPQSRKYGSDLLIYKEVHHNALLTALENKSIQLGEMNFDLERRRALLFWTEDSSVKKRAEKLFSDVEITTRESVISSMRPALTLKGDPVKGQALFQTFCGSCHKFKGKGYEVGPILDEISRKSKESIIHDVLDPNAAVDTKFIQHRLKTKDGQVHLGIIAAENDQFITVLKMGGEEFTTKKANIKSLSSSGRSYMVEGLESSINPQQMADLLAYLQK